VTRPTLFASTLTLVRRHELSARAVRLINRRRRAVIAGGLTLLILGLILGVTLAQADSTPAPAFSKTVPISRVHRNADGTETTVDSRDFTVTVDKTSGLRGNGIINVTWSGAHETRARAADPNSSSAEFTEYPVVLLECRGDDSPGNPTDPSTCFTETMDERSHQTSDVFPPWRLDRYATAADKQQVVGYPDPLPEHCPPPTSPTDRFVPFTALDGTVYRPLGTALSRTDVCGNVLAPEMVTVEQPLAPPGNTTFGNSDRNGDGDAKFVVVSSDENASLGCSDTVKCSLVVIPIEGISCDFTALPADPDQADQAKRECQATGQGAPDQVLATPAEFYVDPAVTGEFWWSESNWRNHVTVPLSFTVPTGVCGSDTRVSLDMFGSELMNQANVQWSALFCQDPTKFKYRHVRLGEPQAKDVISQGQGDVALVSNAPPDGYPNPTVSAPIAVSGFAISYKIDDGKGVPFHDLRLNPRLLAKLLTESYPSEGDDLVAAYAAAPASNPYRAMAHNPFNLLLDPEFVALNPGVNRLLHDSSGGAATSTLLALSGTSDVIRALTSYINADPEARAWLNGAPDPWGMVVNPGYKNIALPVELWPLSDTFATNTVSYFSSCLLPEQWQALTPQPLGPLVASPQNTLALITQQVQYASPNAHVKCSTVQDQSGAVVLATLGPTGRQTPGHRFMLGITDLADAEFVQLDNAALQTHSNITNFTNQFSDDSGRTFVTPSEDSMRAAMALAKPDETSGTWVMPYDALRGSAGTGAYPGTLPIFAAVPTKGLPSTDAAEIAQFLKFAAGDGQVEGTGPGQLPPGYLPLTTANGMADEISYTLRAADAVAAQDGELPSLVAGTGTPTPTPSVRQTTTQPVTVLPPVQPSTSTSSVRVIPFPSASTTPVPAKPVGVTSDITSSYGGWALPAILVISLGAALVGAVIRFIMLLNSSGERS
jgi:hypothetical protein